MYSNQTPLSVAVTSWVKLCFQVFGGVFLLTLKLNTNDMESWVCWFIAWILIFNSLGLLGANPWKCLVLGSKVIQSGSLASVRSEAKSTKGNIPYWSKKMSSASTKSKSVHSMMLNSSAKISSLNFDRLFGLKSSILIPRKTSVKNPWASAALTFIRGRFPVNSGLPTRARLTH